MAPHVIVVGAGPVGCVAAAVLAGRGVRVTLLEAESTLPMNLRASTFHPATLDLLEPLDVLDQMTARGLIADSFAYRDRKDGVRAVFHLADIADATRHPYRLQCEQYKLCEILLDRFAEDPLVSVQFGVSVESAADHGDGASIRLIGGETMSADAIVAADGASSVIRKSLEIGFEGMTYEDRYLALSTSFELADHIDDLTYVNYISDPEEWLVLLRTVDLWRALFPVRDDETDDEALSDESAERRLQRVVARPERYDIAHRTIYRVHQRVADTFRSGRVVLVGDAAHINNPLGGMGMNGGVHDAVLLGSSLAGLLQGAVSDEQLDQHATVRRDLAIDYVKRHSHQNAMSLAARDGDARERALDEMARKAADPELAREYLLQASMLNAVSVMKSELSELGLLS